MFSVKSIVQRIARRYGVFDEEGKMFLNDMHFQVAKEHHKEILRESEKRRLVQIAEAAARQESSSAGVAVWLGDHLVQWGSALQQRGALRSGRGLQIAD